MKKFYAIALLTACATQLSAEPFITEIADPDNDAAARFIEIYNPGPGSIDLDAGDYQLTRWTNGNTTPTEANNIDLTGVMAAGDILVVAANKTTFDTVYSPDTADVDGGTGGPADSNGDDNIALIKGGVLSGTGTIVDLYGVPGTDGSGNAHEFEDGRAERKATVIAANAVFDASEWNIDNDAPSGNGTRDAPGNFDPSAWIGAPSGGNIAPAVSNRAVSTAIPTSSDTITITADATDADGTITSVNIFTSINGGSFTSTAMTVASGDTYTADLGPFADTDTVEYYIEATDDGTDTGALGSDTAPFLLYVNDSRPSAGDIVITELVQGPNTDAPYSQADAEYVEVLNVTGSAVDISYFLLDDSNTRDVQVPAGTIVPAGGYVIFANSAADYNTFGAWTASSGAAPVVDFDFGLGGGGDSFVIKNEALTEIERVDYEDGTNGWPEVNDTGSSFLLLGDPASVDNTDGANWAASNLNGSPGQANVADVTAPTAVSIVRVDATPTTLATVDFTVTFDEAVKNVDVADFALTTTGSVAGNVASVAIVDPVTFTVTVDTITGSGFLGLEFDIAQDVVDFPNNAFAGASPATSEEYDVNPSSVSQWLLLD